MKRHSCTLMKQTSFIRILESDSIHRHRVFRLTTLYHMAVSSLCVPSVNSALYGGQIIVYYSSQYNTTSSSCIPSLNTWRSAHCVFHQSTLHYMAFSSFCVPSVNTVPHGGQIIVCSVSQHCTIWPSDHRVFLQWTLYHMVVRSCIPPSLFEVVIVVRVLSKKIRSVHIHPFLWI